MPAWEAEGSSGTRLRDGAVAQRGCPKKEITHRVLRIRNDNCMVWHRDVPGATGGRVFDRRWIEGL